jgi:hypothetical protein
MYRPPGVACCFGALSDRHHWTSARPVGHDATAL